MSPHTTSTPAQAPATAPQPVYVLGLGLPANPPHAPDHPLLKRAEVIIGGKAQLAPLAGHPAEKLLVGADTAALYERIKANREAGRFQVALCSGDPLFFGLGARLAERFGPDAVRVVPNASSLQAAASLLGRPWEQARAVSLHGRSDMLPLAHALLSGGPVFVLTGPEVTPASVAGWMLERGCSGHSMHVLENLHSNSVGEIGASRRLELSLEEAALGDVDDTASPTQRVLWLEPPLSPPLRPFGLNDADIAVENNLLTKHPIRAAGLAALGIEPWHTVWDLGAGSGAVGIEAARLAWRGQVWAVERDADRLALIRENRRRFGALNLEIVAGTLPHCLPEGSASATPEQGGGQPALPRPDRIFIGGGLGGSRADAEATLTRSWQALPPGGRLLAHCVLLSSLERARETLQRLGAGLSVTLLHASVSAPLAGDMHFQSVNPVFLVLGEKQAK